MNMCCHPQSENFKHPRHSYYTLDKKKRQEKITKGRKQGTSMCERALERKGGWGKEEEEQVQTAAIFSVIDRQEKKKWMVRKRE